MKGGIVVAIAKVRFLETEITNVTIAKGEQFVLEPEQLVRGVEISNLSISSSQPEEIRLRGNTILGLKAGTSTLTVSYIQKDGGSTLEKQAKIKVNVVEPISYVGPFARLLMPIYIRDLHRDWLNSEMNIGSCHQLLEYAKTYGLRTLVERAERSACNDPINEFAVRIWLRQSALFQVDGMNRDIAFLAAVAGVRNAADLARISLTKLVSAFRSLERSANAFLDGELTAPEVTDITAVLETARSMIISSSEYNSIVFEGDPEPTYLMDNDASVRTDSEILNEGLQFLQNITVALPLPRTISGRVVMKDNDNSENMVAMPGCKVQISGIANPAEDRVQDEEDLFCYTDNDGFFSILMPERYNMQECVTLTVTENRAENARNFLDLHTAANAVHTMTFVRRASEIMDAEYIWVHKNDGVPIYIANEDMPRYRKANKGTLDIWKSAKDVLRDFDRLQYLNARNMTLESRVKAKDELKRRETLQLLRMKNSLLSYRTRIDELIAELKSHQADKEKELANAQTRLKEVERKLLLELQFHQRLDMVTLEEKQKQLKDKLAQYNLDQEYILSNVEGIVEKELRDIEGQIAVLKRMQLYSDDQVEQIIHAHSEGTTAVPAVQDDLKATVEIQFSADQKQCAQNLQPVILSEPAEDFQLILEHYASDRAGCAQLVYLKDEQMNLQNQIEYLNEELNELNRVIHIAQQELDSIILPAIDDSALVDALGTDTDYVINPPKLKDYGVEFSDAIEQSMGFLRDIVYDCKEFFACVENYQQSQKDLQQEWANLEDFKQQAISQAAARNFEEYVKGFLLYEDDKKETPKTKLYKVNGGTTEITVYLYSDSVIQEYKDNEEECKCILETIYDLDSTTNDIRQTMINFLTQAMDAYLGDLILIETAFCGEDEKPRALPSVRLMGEGSDAVYLPTDTAPSRIFNYSMLQRLVDPTIAKGNTTYQRKALNQAIDVMNFRVNMRENQKEIPMATSLGMGYMLNMHQAWVPDGFALGSLLYSLVLAPGEEQRIIVQEHTESYTVDDQASAMDTISDTYTNTQEDSETAAFNQAVQRYSAAHSDYEYQSRASSSGKSHIGFFFGLGASSKASSSNSGSGFSNASQTDSYDEASNAAQNFQTEIKTESARLATAKRASIRIASSNETESISSKIIANHNHSHVMTVQYWEVNRRYRMETCIQGIDLVLFVPLQMIRFLPEKTSYTENQNDHDQFSAYTLAMSSYKEFTKDLFNHRYSNILFYSDILMDAVPRKYRGGLKLMQKFASVPEWKLATTAHAESLVTVTLRGHFLETDRLSAQLHFQGTKQVVEGEVKPFDGHQVHPSMNTRKDVLYALKKWRMGIKTVRKTNGNSGRYTDITNGVTEVEVTIQFHLPTGVSKNDIAYMTLENDLGDYQIQLDQSTEYMNAAERLAVNNYNHWKYNFSHDNVDNSKDLRNMDHYKEGLPECCLNPTVILTRDDLLALGSCNLSVEMDDPSENVSNGRFTGKSTSIYLENRIPILGFNEISEMECTLHHICSDTIGYSQVVWGSLTDDERIMMLEPYTVEMKFDKVLSGENYMSNKPITVSLLSCVNAKKLIGFYGNCMLLPFTYPKQLAEVLGKTAAEVQDELYRFHTTNFRVSTTVVSVPTEGMVGEAVLGATNVSEKIDITRFWNWKDSEIDHMNIDQSSFNQHSLLDNADTMTVDAPTQGVQATAHITASDLLTALVNRGQPTFANPLSNTDIRDLLKSADSNAASGREAVVSANAGMINTAVQAAAQVATAALGNPSSLGSGSKNPASSNSNTTPSQTPNTDSGQNPGGTSSTPGTTPSGGGEGQPAPEKSDMQNPDPSDPDPSDPSPSDPSPSDPDPEVTLPSGDDNSDENDAEVEQDDWNEWTNEEYNGGCPLNFEEQFKSSTEAIIQRLKAGEDPTSLLNEVCGSGNSEIANQIASAFEQFLGK